MAFTTSFDSEIRNALLGKRKGDIQLKADDIEQYIKELEEKLNQLKEELEHNNQDIDELKEENIEDGNIFLNIVIDGPNKKIKFQYNSNKRKLEAFNDLQVENKIIQNSIINTEKDIKLCKKTMDDLKDKKYCTLDPELKKILLRRRNKVIVYGGKSIYDKFKKGIESRISKIDDLKDLGITVEKCERLSVTIKFNNGIKLEFEDGNLKNQQLNDDFLPSSSSRSILFNIIKEETQKIKNKMVYALTLNKELQNLGYCMDEMLFNVVVTLPSQEVKSLSDELIPYINILIGANVTYHPLYPNFPSQVMDMKIVDLYINALIHYWSSGVFYPPTEVNKRSKAPINVKYKYITLGEEKDLHDLFFNIMNSAEAISPQDIIDLTTYFQKYENFMDTVPENIRNKENLAIVTKLILTHCKEPDMEKISRRFSTVTDVLRFAAVLSDQSATLCGKVRFKSFPQKERRFIMELLNSCGNRVDDFHKHKNLWVRLCERIHPKKYRKVYPDLVDDLEGTYKYIQEKKNLQKQKQSIDTIHSVLKNDQSNSHVKSNEIYDAISQLKKLKFNKDLIKKVEDHFDEKEESKESTSSTELENTFTSIQNRNESKIMELEEKAKEYKDTHRTFNSKLEKFLNEKKFNEALKLLVNRPGILARRLDDLIEKMEDKSKLFEAFEEIASQVSVKVLLSLKGYFQKRHEKLKARVFLIKNKTTSKLYMKRKVKKELELEVCQKICHICEEALKTHFEEKAKMNNVYISDDLKKHVIPLDLRTSSAAVETYAKGSRFDIMSCKEELEEELESLELPLKEDKEKLDKLKETLETKNQKIDELENGIKAIVNELKNGVEDEAVQKSKEKEKQDIIKSIKEVKKEINEKEKEIKEKADDIKENEEKIDEVKRKLKNESSKTKNSVRLFIWWTNTRTSRIDIDLSVMLYDENLHQLSHVSFTNLRDSKYKIYHSGDITNGGDINGPGAAEFIDFDPEEIYKNGARYVATSVICFSGVPFDKLENCKFGWMEREDLNSNELFEPKTVRQRIDVKSQNTSTVPVVFDCKTREVVWIDSNLTESQGAVCIERSKKPMNAILYYYLNPLKDSMYNLLKLHVEARDGHLVESKNELQEGDIAFVSYLPYRRIPGVEYVRPSDLDIILSEYMSSSS